MTTEMLVFIAGLGLFCLLLSALGALADIIDSTDHRDARRRNQARRMR